MPLFIIVILSPCTSAALVDIKTATRCFLMLLNTIIYGCVYFHLFCFRFGGGTINAGGAWTFGAINV